MTENFYLEILFLHQNRPTEISLISILDQLVPTALLSNFSKYYRYFFIRLFFVNQHLFFFKSWRNLKFKSSENWFMSSGWRFFWMWKSKYLYFLVIFLVKKKFSNNDMIITVLKSYCDTFEPFETLRKQLTNVHFLLVESTSEDSLNLPWNLRWTLYGISYTVISYMDGYLKSIW